MARFRQRLLMRLVSLYPPYLGAGIRVSYPKGDAYRIVARMGLHWWNKNLFGTQFGGSLYSMCDPQFVFIVLRNLGPGYVVWNKSAQIEFLRPGRGRMTATFVVPREKIDEITYELLPPSLRVRTRVRLVAGSQRARFPVATSKVDRKRPSGETAEAWSLVAILRADIVCEESR